MQVLVASGNTAVLPSSPTILLSTCPLCLGDPCYVFPHQTGGSHEPTQGLINEPTRGFINEASVRAGLSKFKAFALQKNISSCPNDKQNHPLDYVLVTMTQAQKEASLLLS